MQASLHQNSTIPIAFYKRSDGMVARTGNSSTLFGLESNLRRFAAAYRLASHLVGAVGVSWFTDRAGSAAEENGR